MYNQHASILSSACCVILLTILTIIMNGCTSLPHYRSMDEKNTDMTTTANVNYQLYSLPQIDSVNCVAILPLSITPESSAEILFNHNGRRTNRENMDNKSTPEGAIKQNEIYDLVIDSDDKRKMVRRMLYAFMSPHSTVDIELSKIDRVLQTYSIEKDAKTIAKKLDCDWMMRGEVTEFSAKNYGLYSAIEIAADLEIFRATDGKIIWQGNHKASSHDGAVPLTPIDLAIGAIKASSNLNPDQVERIASDLARRLVRTMPLDSDNNFVIAEERQQLLHVIASKLNLRKGPGTGYAVSQVLNNNDQVTLLKETKNTPWILIKTGTGEQGYVSKRFVN